MNHRTPRKDYGTLSLSSADARGLQLEWHMVERPAAPARYLNFPFAEEDTSAPLGSPHSTDARKEKRPLAA
jgi:hypothetical protein